MVKKLTILALVGLMAMPAIATAGGRKSATDLENKIEDLARQLDELKAQLAKQN